jgi:hypothetical protein
MLDKTNISISLRATITGRSHEDMMGKRMAAPKVEMRISQSRWLT